ncbi:phosphate ABC transporter substrate-binding/OmpA family protein [Rhodobacteraceae bacterium 10Alg 79]|uniref:Phosphate ABC transporter substrate-binding/OmpA family protein n=1 Tax=Rhodalgimonas zhirmunskyi TaxID=2964767 RepID=A0AAJ1U796_9RHOB|nr:phosphate ABC transporter substrate-binding/OmpA family protein [Rhodoalgimonas zhirmunskyi]MDQ2094259.1 phosphate ABC transporter substrate-binding/OmpA family protein [Rhodoalgimonas zhirmunskyi]
MVRAAGFAALSFSTVVTLAALPGRLAAQDVTLRSTDGAVELSGTLLSFDGEFYRLDTVYGELTVDGSGVSCEGPGCPSLLDFVAELDISGAATMGDLILPALIEAFAGRQGLEMTQSRVGDTAEFLLTDRESRKLKARFRLRMTNSDEGFADLIADEADIAMTVREITQEEARHGAEAGLGDLKARGRVRVLSLDALVAVVAPGNPVQAISTPQLADVFGGKIRNWSELGGPDAPITLHLRDAGSGLGQAAEAKVLAPAKLKLAGSAIRHRGDAALSAAVMRDPFGIGLASYAARSDLQVLNLTGACGFTLAPTRRTIKTEDYPLTAPMFLYLPARRLPKLAREFLSFTRSSSGQLVIRRAGFVDQQPEEIVIGDQGDRLSNAIRGAGEDVALDTLQEMVGRLWGMKRLSISFRFEAGSVRLDAQSRSNVEQLARSLEIGRYDGRELLFVGFSDGQGPAAGNKTISERRARRAMEAVLAAAETANRERLKVSSVGFGEALPMACDDSEWGRQVNRRVEVWLR